MNYMKILYWTPEFHPEIGGIEELSKGVLPAFQKRGYEFLVVTSHGRQRLPDLTDFNGIPVYRFYFREALGKRDLKKIIMYQKRIAQLKKSFNPDLVHFHFGDPYGYFHVTTASAHPAPSLVTLHMSVADYGNGPDTMIGKLLNQSSWVVGVSKATLTDAYRAVPAISKRSSVIYNGLDFPRINQEPLDFNEPRVLCLGRVFKDKGFDLAIASFVNVRKRFPKSRLVIAGDGLARVELEKQAAELGLNGAVDFLGWVDPEDVPGLINRATIVALPSRWREPFPLVALQAAQMARPVVAARVGGLPECIIHRKTGLLIDREDSQQLADAISFLLEHPKLAIQYGLYARKRVEEVFSVTSFLDAYDRLYKKLTSAGSNNGKGWRASLE